MKNKIIPFPPDPRTFLSRFAAVWISFLCLALACPEADAQATPAARDQKADKPRVTLVDSAWTGKGELVLAIKVWAASDKGFFMGKNMGGGEMAPFSLENSYLMDENGKEKISPLPFLPEKPYFGPSYTLANLGAGGNIRLGIAFPKLPNPGKDEKGLQKPYKLKFFPPMELEPIDIEIPYPSEPAKAAPAS